ncbi:hypothetical protein SAY87_007821 [Trapa incisa]|uniref:Uncharacterized protein n=1 Tax=Trapa incisa TaxID=236973 RepID=A0AAN7KF09_9MYRT|nr:hypothetical protein SAY87_007821 [Trapa incisa]
MPIQDRESKATEQKDTLGTMCGDRQRGFTPASSDTCNVKNSSGWVKRREEPAMSLAVGVSYGYLSLSLPRKLTEVSER